MKGNYETVRRNGKLYKRHQLDYAETDLIPVEEFKNISSKQRWESSELYKALKRHEQQQELEEIEAERQERLDPFNLK